MRLQTSAMWVSGFLFSVGSTAIGVGSQFAVIPFPEAAVHFEQNATDGDVEVVFEVSGGDEGLAELTIVSPDGRTVVDFEAPTSSTLGMRSFRFESPEPTDVDLLKGAYPEGEYTFSGRTFSGERLAGKSSLSHRLPETATLRAPRADAEDVAVNDLVIAWEAVADVSSYQLELAQEGSDVSLSAVLPNATASFRVPDGFLSANSDYQLSIGTVNDEGNLSFVEIGFETGN